MIKCVVFCIIIIIIMTISDLDNFPMVARRGSESPSERRSTSRRGNEYNHDTEVIFVLPSLQMHLKTVHKQGAVEPQEGGEIASISL